LSATLASRRKTSTIAETGAVIAMTSHDQICVDGLLDTGAPVSIHYRGGSSRGTNLLWEINGTEGDLQITSYGGHAQIFKLTLLGARGAETAVQVMPIPDKYRWAPPQPAPGFATNVAQTYAMFARDYRDGTHYCPTFDDAVRRHRLLQAIETAAASGQRQTLR
jgi:predicted dehydrogenase